MNHPETGCGSIGKDSPIGINATYPPIDGGYTPVTRDPWQHRSLGMKCTTCMWWAVKQAGLATDARGAVGRCRRHAPTMSGYPAVFATDWCGDHKLDEAKI